MQPNDKTEERAPHANPGMADPENPVQGAGPGGTADQEAIKALSGVGINPQNTASMSRAEDDGLAQAHSLEFHDRLGQGNKA